MRETGSELLFLDSNVWLGYFLGKGIQAKEIIESEANTLFTSVISVHEIFKKLKKTQTEKEAKEKIEFIEDNSVIIGLNKETSIKAVENCEKYGLHTMDSLIYTSAMETNSLFITADNDFQKTPKTRIIKLEGQNKQNFEEKIER